MPLPTEPLQKTDYEHLNVDDLSTHLAFSRFIQLNEQETRKLINLMTHEPRAAGIFMYIAEKMDGYNAVVMSHKVIMERFGISKPTVCRAIKILTDYGFINVKKSGTTNVYIANPNLVWKSYGRNRKYCEFDAKVVLSASEQIEDNDEVNEKVIVQQRRVMLDIHDRSEYENPCGAP